MTLAGQAVENLVKGLFVRENPRVVRTADQVANGASVLARPANSHDTRYLLGPDGLGISLPDDEASIAQRLELAVRWHGRYPTPVRVHDTRVKPLDGNAESNNIGFWSSNYRPIIDRLYGR
jgi:hypothetical protein